ncbi:MAG: PilZ domain-containing protein [Bryobacteraceae bacterium]
MQERRLEARLLCADLIDVHWTDKSGRSHTALANLEDISLSGLCLQMDMPVPHETVLRIAHPKTELAGRVRYCVFRETGYFLGVQFEPGFRWTRRHFCPKHLLDPRRLVALSVKRAVKKREARQKPPAQ